MLLDPRAVHIYTDGSCYGNPGGTGGAAAYVEYPDHLHCGPHQIVDFGCGETTNNRMELLACIRALKWIRANKPWPGVSRVQIVTDSRYVLDNIARVGAWKRLDWRNVHGEAKENSDLWTDFLRARGQAGIRVDFCWRKGKISPLLKEVDRAAKSAASVRYFGTDAGFRRGKISRSKIRGSAKIFPARDQIAVIRPYRKTAAGKAETRVRFDLYDERHDTYLDSYYACAGDVIALDLHRQHLYRVKFNDAPRNPRIEEIIDEVER